MSSRPHSATATVWLSPEQLGLVRSIAQVAGLRVVGVGSPALGRASEMASELNAGGHAAAALDDLRQALGGAEGEVFVIASPGEFGRGQRDVGTAGPGGDAGSSVTIDGRSDASVLAARRGRAGGAVVVSFEPMPASVLDLEVQGPEGGPTAAEQAGVVLGQQPATSVSAGASEWAAFVPLFRLGRSILDAREVLAQAGTPHTMSVEFLCAEGEGTLGARVFDALELVTSLMGEPDSVDAAYVWPGRGRVVHAMPGDTLHGLRGGLSANLRFSDGRGAAVVCADGSVGAGKWSRRVTLVGDGGRVTIDDAGFEFVSAGGAVDRSRGWRGGQETTAAQVFGEAITRLIDPHAGGNREVPTDWARVLSAAGAALLSARTGEVESPATILRMARTV